MPSKAAAFTNAPTHIPNTTLMKSLSMDSLPQGKANPRSSVAVGSTAFFFTRVPSFAAVARPPERFRRILLLPA